MIAIPQRKDVVLTPAPSEVGITALLSVLKRTTLSNIRKIPSDRWCIILEYLIETGRWPNLRSPRGFNEKINWRKLHQRDPRFTVFTDKLTAKIEIAKIIGEKHIVPTLWSGTRPEDIPFDRLQPPYLIKTNHRSGGTLFIERGDIIDRDAIIAHVRPLLAKKYWRRREWAYYGIAPQVFVERKLETRQGKIPEDYKFYVYHGKVHFVHVEYERCGEVAESYHDAEWRFLPITKGVPPVPGPYPRPQRLAEMIAIAERIGAQFDFVRVDLYGFDAGVFFGETTFYPAAGYSPVNPREWECTFGAPWHPVPYAGEQAAKASGAIVTPPPSFIRPRASA